MDVQKIFNFFKKRWAVAIILISVAVVFINLTPRIENWKEKWLCEKPNLPLVSLPKVDSLFERIIGCDNEEGIKVSRKNMAKNMGSQSDSQFFIWPETDDEKKQTCDFIKTNFPQLASALYALIAFLLLQFLTSSQGILGFMRSRKEPNYWNFIVKNVIREALPKDSRKFFDKWVAKASTQTKEEETERPPPSLTERIEGKKLLFLIDGFSSRDHFQAFWKNTVDSIANKNEIVHDVFLYQGDPRRAYRDMPVVDQAAKESSATSKYELSQDESLASTRLLEKENKRLKELSEEYPDAILIVVGDGMSLLNVHDNKPKRWARELFENWSVRYLLTPRNPLQWDVRENKHLAGLFHVLPAQIKSLEYVRNLPNDQASTP